MLRPIFTFCHRSRQCENSAGVMADHREPPPLFDDDDSRKDDDNEDLFSSAVQSPVNGQVTPDVTAVSSTTTTARAASPALLVDSLPDSTSSTAAAAAAAAASDSTLFSHSDSPIQTVHPFSDPLQHNKEQTGSAVSSSTADPSTLSPDSAIAVTTDTISSSSDPNNSSESGIVQSSVSSSSTTATMLEPISETASSTKDGLEDLGEAPSSLDYTVAPNLSSSAITNLPPVPSNMYNISNMTGVVDGDNNMDLFESCVEDVVIRPFSSVTLSEPQEVSLDDDDDGLFTGGVMDSAQLKTSMDTAGISNSLATTTITGTSSHGGPPPPTSASAATTPASNLPTMGAPITPATTPSAGVGAALYDTAAAAADVNNGNTANIGSSSAGAGEQQSNLGYYAQSSPDRIVKEEDPSEFIEIVISEPQKVGDGMYSYMAYKMTTRTNIPFFRKQSWSVTRRFSDYLGLHTKLVEKHLHAGRIIPPAPEKDAINTTKLRLSSGEGAEGAAEFLERRRASLQRYMQRTAALPHLRSDPDFREFIELDSELPPAKHTSAMSGAGVMRLFNRVGETVNKITFKMEESDQWFEERAHQVESLELELRRLHAALEGLAGGRRELALCSSTFSKAAAVLSSVEEHSALSRALHQLAEATDRTHTVYHAQADADFYILCETTRDYINLIGAVKEVFHERVKVFQAWQYSQTMLAKKRDAKAKLELTARQEKVAQAQQEVQEWEGKVERNQEHFTRISASIKQELQQFDVVRVQDFKNMLVRYLEAMVTSQQQVIKVWESFLPEAKAIS